MSIRNCTQVDQHGRPCINPLVGTSHEHDSGHQDAGTFRQAEFEADDTTRPFVLHVCADGTVTIRNQEQGEPVFNGAALPVYSTTTREEAEALRGMLCSRVPAEHPLLPGQKWYKVPRFSGSLDEMPVVAARMRHLHATLKANAMRRTGTSQRSG